MKENIAKTPEEMRLWELALLGLLVLVCVILAFTGRGRKEREAYDRFLEAAPKIQEALERYAADHGGAFPPDAMFNSRPQGLGDKYIAWREDWRADYEVHDNGHGGKFVCLEFGGPFKQRQYFGLCTKPDIRKNYGKGQTIPGNTNLIWVIREEAPIMPKK